MNNDRFKFRVWDNDNKRYDEGQDDDSFTINHHGILLCDHYDTVSEQDKLLFPDDYGKDRYLLEQCTGLKDKNGKLIYEGDIVNLYPAETINHKERIVVWGRCGWTTVRKNTSIYCNFGSHEIEVIGNIHEKEGAER